MRPSRSIDAGPSATGPAPHARPRKAKRPAPGTARHIKAASKRPGATAAKRPGSAKPPRKTTQAAE